VEPLLTPPIGFAHRGARAHAPENSLDAFRLGLRLGATGLESDVWLSADGVPVLDHDGVVRTGLRKRRIADVPRDALPDHLVTLEALYEACGTDYELSLDLKDPRSVEPVLAVASRFPGAAGRLWLCHPEVAQVSGWRGLSTEFRLVNSTRRRHVKEGMERRAATLADAGVDALNLHHTDWTGGFTTLMHRFGVLALAWDCQHPRVLADVLHMGVDAVYSDHVDRMVDALAAAAR
jgi:glycerophosphoryl diester phosphodiesterase